MSKVAYDYGLTSPDEWLEELARQYAATGNPLAVWYAVQCWANTGATLPAFAREYLGRVATELCALSESDDDLAGTTRETLRGTRAERMAKVLDTLNLRPRGRGRKPDAFESWAAPRAAALVALVDLCRETGGMTRAAAIDMTARIWRVGERTVRRALEESGRK